MAKRLPLVRANTPQILMDLVSPVTGLPLDLSPSTTLINLRVRRVGGALKAIVTCSKVTGRTMEDGTINVNAPYNVEGAGGRCVANCPATVFDSSGSYEAEVEVRSTGGIIRTDYSFLKFTVRDEII